jgi:ABC-type nitrate/sulfonate/bicarbonate transport system permease component
MPEGLSSLCIALAIALVVGVWLGHAIASRFPHRRWSLYLLLWVVGLLPRLALLMLGRAPGAPTAILAGIPLVAICAAEGFRESRARWNAARSLGASEWRIFWRVFLPHGWTWLAGGALLAALGFL